MKLESILSFLMFLFIITKSYGQYDNKYIIGFSTSGFYGSFTSESGLQQQAFYTELIPNIGLRVYDSLYVFIEGGRSFTFTKNIQEPPTFYMLGMFTRYYFKKKEVFDLYTGLSFGLTNLDLVEINDRIEVIDKKKLSTSIINIYAGTNIRLYKKLSCSVEYGLRYCESLGLGLHKKLLFQVSF